MKEQENKGQSDWPVSWVPDTPTSVGTTTDITTNEYSDGWGQINQNYSSSPIESPNTLIQRVKWKVPHVLFSVNLLLGVATASKGVDEFRQFLQTGNEFDRSPDGQELNRLGSIQTLLQRSASDLQFSTGRHTSYPDGSASHVKIEEAISKMTEQEKIASEAVRRIDDTIPDDPQITQYQGDSVNNSTFTTHQDELKGIANSYYQAQKEFRYSSEAQNILDQRQVHAKRFSLFGIGTLAFGVIGLELQAWIARIKPKRKPSSSQD